MVLLILIEVTTFYFKCLPCIMQYNVASCWVTGEPIVLSVSQSAAKLQQKK